MDGFGTETRSHVSIKNTHVIDGDDCVSFKNGSNFITGNNITCMGSHDLSVGSLRLQTGFPYIARNIYVSNAKMINCTPAIHIQFFPDDPSRRIVLVSNVTDKDVTVDNCYESNHTACMDYSLTAELTKTEFINITGKTSLKYNPKVAKIYCPPSGTCDITFT
ncbi:unnamed protein product [Adineta ricciae]|uniref:Uncharacterized protein n=1 Tax=Adineta ricciae TaxID=249248 RepID=A0A814D1A1_ADIRI|nr:unnamed protein product [Adineta ricciae]CAF1306099.1 unnamed protein product [Adineta ricciae]